MKGEKRWEPLEMFSHMHLQKSCELNFTLLGATKLDLNVTIRGSKLVWWY